MLWNPTEKLITDDFPVYDGQEFSGCNVCLEENIIYMLLKVSLGLKEQTTILMIFLIVTFHQIMMSQNGYMLFFLQIHYRNGQYLKM